METNDFIGSFADENVIFRTQVIRTSRVGDNYWRVMVFVESDRYVDATTEDWSAIPGGTSAQKACVVNADTYGSITSGLLNSWLSDLFINGFVGDAVLVTYAAKLASDADADAKEAHLQALDSAYELMKAYAYHKTICAGENDSTVTCPIGVELAVELAKLCAQDKGLLSSAPYYPFITQGATLANDALYSALKTAGYDAFMTSYADATRNGSLYSLGLTLTFNGGGQNAVGSSLDMVKSGNIASSGAGGTVQTPTIKRVLQDAHISYFKPIGDNSGNVAALGDRTINGDIVGATWIISYVTYMLKVNIAQMITVPNFLFSANNYQKILGQMMDQLSVFGPTGNGRLADLTNTAPSFDAIAASGMTDEFVIANAWSASYVDHVRKVTITGNLYIGG